MKKQHDPLIEEVQAKMKGDEPAELYITARIRDLCRQGFEASLPSIVAIAKGEHEESTPAVQIRAHESLAKHGLGNDKTMIVDKERWMGKLWMITAKHINDRDKFVAWAAEVEAAIKHAE